MRLLVYGDIGGSGGYVRYCKGLFGSGVVPDEMEVYFVCSSKFYEQLVPLDKKVKVIVHPWPASKSRLKRYLWHLWLFPKLVRDLKPDVEFYPSGQRRVYLRKAVTVTTCHNLLLFDKKEIERFQVEDQAYFQQYRKSQASSYLRSSGVIFLSGHSRQVVSAELPELPPSKVIAHGLDPVFLRAKDRSYELSNVVRLLYVSPAYPYKNQSAVIEGVIAARGASKLDIRLRLVGGGPPETTRQIQEKIDSEGAAEFVEIVGAVDYSSLQNEYDEADLFIFASSCETFGITLLEAMGARLPIACADKTGLSEILKDAGVYFNPEDVSSIAAALIQLMESSRKRLELGELAHRYAKEYTWSRCAELTFDYLKTLSTAYADQQKAASND